MHSSKIHRSGVPRGAADQVRGCALLWLLLLTGLLIVMVLQQWKLCLTVIICSSISLLARRKTEQIYETYGNAKKRPEEELKALFEESAAGHKLIRISEAERSQQACFASRNQTYYEANRKMNLCSMVACQIVPICSMTGTVIILSCSSVMILHGSADMKTAILFLCYFFVISYIIGRLEACRRKLPIVYSPEKSIVSEKRNLIRHHGEEE